MQNILNTTKSVTATMSHLFLVSHTLSAPKKPLKYTNKLWINKSIDFNGFSINGNEAVS